MWKRRASLTLQSIQTQGQPRPGLYLSTQTPPGISGSKMLPHKIPRSDSPRLTVGKINQDTSLWQMEAGQTKQGRTPEAVLPLLSPPHAGLQFPLGIKEGGGHWSQRLHSWGFRNIPRGPDPLVPWAAPRTSTLLPAFLFNKRPCCC